MKLDPPPAPFSLFSGQLPTDERLDFSSRADSIFASLDPTSVPTVPSELLMQAPSVPAQRTQPMTIEEEPVSTNYSSSVSDKVNPVSVNNNRVTGKRSYRDFRSDHDLNPNKYTSYSLAETRLTDERQNKAVALSFLSDLDKKKASPVKEEAADLSAPILFKKKTAVQTECTTKPAKAGNAVVQGEYIIGQTSSKSNRLKHIAAVKTQHSAGVKSAPVTKLSLEEDEEEIPAEEMETNVVKMSKGRGKRNIRKRKDSDEEQ